MAHVRSHKTGKHAEHVDGVLNEIAAAKRVLLDVEKKADYDSQLRLKTAKPAAKAPPPVAQPIAAPPAEIPLPPPSPAQISSAPPPITRPAPLAPAPPASSTIAPLLFALLGVGAIFLLLLVGGVGALWWLRASPAQVQVANSIAIAEPSSEPIDGNVTTELEPTTETPTETPPTPTPTEEPPIAEPPTEPDVAVEEPVVEDPPPAEPVDDPVAEPAEETPAEEPASSGPPAHIAALFPEQLNDNRLPIPTPEATKQNAARIAQIFHIDEARTPEAKAELAQRMLQTGRDTVDDADSQYELINQARMLAASVGDVETTFAALDQLRQLFQVRGDELAAFTVGQLLDSPAPLERRKETVQRGVAIVDACLSHDHYVEAAGLIKDLLTAARRNRDVEQIAALTARQKIGSELYAGYKAATPAIERLRADPTDADAALSAGKFYAFVKGDWNVGLPLLAASSDAELRRLAAVEMQSITDSTAQRTLADGWYALAGDAKTADANRQRARARLWYGKAVGRLSGLPKVEVEQRLEELAKVTVDGGAPYDSGSDFEIATSLLTATSDSRKAKPKVIDLLEVVAEQPLNDEWKFDQQGRLLPIGRAPRLQIRQTLPREYLLEAVVVDLTPQQPGVPLAITLGQGTRSFQLDFDSRLNKREYYTGVQPVDGVQSNQNSLAFRGQAMRSDRANVVRMLVGEKRFAVNVNGVDIIAYEGDMRRIGAEQRQPIDGFDLHLNRQEWALASLKLAPLSDDVPPPADDVAEIDAAKLEPGEIDLDAPDDEESPAEGELNEINFGKKLGNNVISGNWKGRGPQLQIAAFNAPALYQLPQKPAREYHLQLDLTRRGKGSELAIGLVYQGVQCVVVLDRDNQTSSAIVGHSLTDGGEKDFVVSREHEVLPASTRVTIDCVVRADSFSVSIDGEKFLEFTGDTNWDGPGDAWRPRDSDVLFLGANNAEFDIHSVRMSTTAGREANAPDEDVGP